MMFYSKDMKSKPLIPEILTWSDLPKGVRLEVWRTPLRGPGFTVYCLVGGTEVGKHSYRTEVAARKNFERMVEERA